MWLKVRGKTMLVRRGLRGGEVRFDLLVDRPVHHTSHALLCMSEMKIESNIGAHHEEGKIAFC